MTDTLNHLPHRSICPMIHKTIYLYESAGDMVWSPVFCLSHFNELLIHILLNLSKEINKDEVETQSGGRKR